MASDGGVHIAALGGVWMMAVLGFAGLSLRPDGIAIDPQLPAEMAQPRLRSPMAGPPPDNPDQAGPAQHRSDARVRRRDDIGREGRGA